jgi:anti-sigma factor RsiW
MDSRTARELADAYLDGELAPAARDEFARHLRDHPADRAHVEERARVNAALRGALDRPRAPDDLARRIGAALAPDSFAHGRPRAGWYRPLVLAASFASVALVSSLLTWRMLPPDGAPALTVADRAIDGHLRALVSQHLTDVASSDQHTVRPWFNGRIDLAPPVRDLTAAGFPLVGGRVDYLDGRPAAALVYRHRQHVVSLFVAALDPARPPAAGELRRQGYQALGWTRDGFAFWAVSDLNFEDLRKLRDVLAAP